MTSKKTLYLANPYGFSLQQREGPLAALVAALEAMGAEIWEPFARNNQIGRAGPGWSYRVGQADLRDVRKADGLFAVVNGCPPDEGVMVELGLAIAWEKPVFLFRDDFRRCTDSDAYPLNLMLFTGLPETGWGSLLVRLDRGNYRSRQGTSPSLIFAPTLERVARVWPRATAVALKPPPAGLTNLNRWLRSTR